MFLGHFAAAMAAKRAAPATSLGALVAAAQWPDLLWPVLLLTGAERAAVERSPDAPIPLQFIHYPWSHSLLAVLGWSVLAAALWWWRSRELKPALVIGALVCSHWLLDLLVHIPDLPLTPAASSLWGIGLWRWKWAAFGVELLCLAVGVWIYAACRRRGQPADWRLYSLAAFLALIQVANTFGPPAPGITPVAWSGMAMWLLVLWAWWADRPRPREKNGRDDRI